MIADYQDGGQKMLDIIEFNKALKISWILKIFQIYDCKSKWKSFFDFHSSKVGGKLVFLGNLEPKDARKLYIKNDFIQELIELWTDLNYKKFPFPVFQSRGGGGGYSLIWAIYVCAAPKGMVFQPFWS